MRTHPILIIDEHTNARQTLANTIRELVAERGKLGHKVYRLLLADIKQRNRRGREQGLYLKPSPYNMRRLASLNLMHSKVPIRDGSSEYYSRCGHEDYQAQKRYEAKWNAVEYFQAYRQLVGQGDYCQPFNKPVAV